MNICDLIKIEKYYINERSNGIENIDFPLVLQENGFTPEAFQREKANCYIKTFNPTIIIGEVRANEGENYELGRAMENKNSIIFGLPAQKVVWYSVDGSFNLEYCDENKILCKKRPYNGGVICSLPSDLDVSIIAQEAPIMFPDVVLEKLANWIKGKTSYEVEVAGNDILVSGNKVLGMANYTYGNMMLCGFHTSFELDADFILNVCQKEIKKMPCGLNEFGEFNRNELISEMISWLR